MPLVKEPRVELQKVTDKKDDSTQSRKTASPKPSSGNVGYLLGGCCRPSSGKINLRVLREVVFNHQDSRCKGQEGIQENCSSACFQCGDSSGG